MSQSKLHPEYLRQKALQDAYLARKNKKTDFYNGIYDRWENPVLTREFPFRGGSISTRRRTPTLWSVWA